MKPGRKSFYQAHIAAATLAAALALRAMPADTGKPDTLFLPCVGREPRTTRGPVLRSTAYSAYVEVRAVWRSEQAGRQCEVTASLYVKPEASREFKLVYQKKPSPEELGHGLRPVDWSSDGQLLLMESSWWQPDSDLGGRGVEVYDALRHSVRKLGFASALSAAVEKNCSVRLDAVRGFSDNGEAVIDVGDFVDAYSESQQPKCFTVKTRWAVSLDGKKARPLPAGAPIRKNASPRPSGR